MGLDFEMQIWKILSIALPLGIFFLLYFITNVFISSCMVGIISGFFLFYFLLWAQDHITIGRQKDKTESSDIQYSKKREKSSPSFLSKFSRKKTCDECGTELVYKETYDSYYCPECHEYK